MDGVRGEGGEYARVVGSQEMGQWWGRGGVFGLVRVQQVAEASFGYCSEIFGPFHGMGGKLRLCYELLVLVETRRFA